MESFGSLQNSSNSNADLIALDSFSPLCRVCWGTWAPSEHVANVHLQKHDHAGTNASHNCCAQAGKQAGRQAAALEKTPYMVKKGLDAIWHCGSSAAQAGGGGGGRDSLLQWLRSCLSFSLPLSLTHSLTLFNVRGSRTLTHTLATSHSSHSQNFSLIWVHFYRPNTHYAPIFGCSAVAFCSFMHLCGSEQTGMDF